jgi:dihydroorotate dehydrogenase
MFDFFFSCRETLIALFYRYILKPIFFRLDPEDVHDKVTVWGARLGQFSLSRFLTALAFDYRDLSLEQELFGLKFKNPVGLAAGFDKDGLLAPILPSVGFGFSEVGSVHWGEVSRQS